MELKDTSKVRHRIRKKLGEEKKYLQELVEEYNLIAPVVSSDFVALSEVDTQGGNWPWITVIGHDNIPTRMKRRIVEKNLEFNRLCEEEDLVADEMKSVLNYFHARGDYLKQMRACLVRKLEDNDFNLSGSAGRYTFSESPNYPVIGGYLALIERQYCCNLFSDILIERQYCCNLFSDILIERQYCCNLFSDILNDSNLFDEMLNVYDEEMLDVDDNDILENLDDFTLEEIDEFNL